MKRNGLHLKIGKKFILDTSILYKYNNNNKNVIYEQKIMFNYESFRIAGVILKIFEVLSTQKVLCERCHELKEKKRKN